MQNQTSRGQGEREGVKAATEFLLVLLLAAGDALAAGEESRATAKSAPHYSAGKKQIIVSIPDRKLVLLHDGRVLRIYTVAVGASVSPSPTGKFQVVSHVIDPTYYHKGKMIPPGPTNPLGNRWMGIDKKGYGIHGTNVPSSIGKAASHGCIRMAKQDVEELFALVNVGDEVEIIGKGNPRLTEKFGSQTGSETAQQTHSPISPAVSAVVMALASGAL